MGGSRGNFGLLINMVDKTGSTSLTCRTFRQFWPLTRELKFKIQQLEVWMVVEDSVRMSVCPDVQDTFDCTADSWDLLGDGVGKKVQLDDVEYEVEEPKYAKRILTLTMKPEEVKTEDARVMNKNMCSMNQRKRCQCCSVQRKLHKTNTNKMNAKASCLNQTIQRHKIINKSCQCCTIQRRMKASCPPDVNYGCKKEAKKCEIKRYTSSVCEIPFGSNNHENKKDNSRYQKEVNTIKMELVTRQHKNCVESGKDSLHPPITQTRHYKRSHTEADRGGFVHPSENPNAHLDHKRKHLGGKKALDHTHRDSFLSPKPKLGNVILDYDIKQDNSQHDPSTNSKKTNTLKPKNETSLGICQRDNSFSGSRRDSANENKDVQDIAVPVKRGEKSYVDFQVQVGENKISVVSCRLTNTCACTVTSPCSCSLPQPNVEKITPKQKPRPTSLTPNLQPPNPSLPNPPITPPTTICVQQSLISIKTKPEAKEIEQPILTLDKEESAAGSRIKMDLKTKDSELPFSNENESSSAIVCRCSCTTVTCSDLEIDSTVNSYERPRPKSHCSCDVKPAITSGKICDSSYKQNPLLMSEKSLAPSDQGLTAAQERDTSSFMCSCELGAKDKSVPSSLLDSQRQLAESTTQSPLSPKTETQYLTQACRKSDTSLSHIMSSVLKQSIPPTCLTCRSVVGSTGCRCKTVPPNTKLTPILEQASQFQQQPRHSSILKSEQKSGSKSRINRVSSVIINTQHSPNMSGSSNCSCGVSKPEEDSKRGFARSCRCNVSSDNHGGRCMCKVKTQVKNEDSRSESTTLSPGSKEIRMSNTIPKKCQCSLARSCFPQFPEELLPNSDRSKNCGCCSDTNVIRFPTFPDPEPKEDNLETSTLSEIESEQNSKSIVVEKRENDNLGCPCVKEDGTIIILNVAKCNTMQAMEKIIQELDVKYPIQLGVPDNSVVQIESRDMKLKPCNLGEEVDREALKRLMDAKMKGNLKEQSELKTMPSSNNKILKKP